MNIDTANRCIKLRNKFLSFRTRYYQEQNTGTRNNEIFPKQTKTDYAQSGPNVYGLVPIWL